MTDSFLIERFRFLIHTRDKYNQSLTTIYNMLYSIMFRVNESYNQGIFSQNKLTNYFTSLEEISTEFKSLNLPLSIMLLNKKATVTLCNEFTENIKSKTIDADILITACGQPKMIKKDWIKENVIIVDVGINRDENNKLCGDVDYNDVIDKVEYITPVPGGVGPITVCMLLNNLVK